MYNAARRIQAPIPGGLYRCCRCHLQVHGRVAPVALGVVFAFISAGFHNRILGVEKVWVGQVVGHEGQTRRFSRRDCGGK